MTTEVTAPFTEGSGTGVPQGAPSTRPENVPEKFWDAEKGAVRTEDLLKSYAELEKSRGSTPPVDPPAQGEPAADPAPKEEQAAADAATAAGVSIGDLEAEYTKDGTLSEASYASLAKAGFDKSVVDEFIAYRAASSAETQKGFMALVGGEDEFSRMTAWAGKSYTKDQVEAFNDAVNSGKKGAIEVALKALKADYTAANPARPKLVQGETGAAASSGGVYESMAQLMKDQADPRYSSDPAFRAAVAAKVARSNIR